MNEEKLKLVEYKYDMQYLDSIYVYNFTGKLQVALSLRELRSRMLFTREKCMGIYV